MVQETVAAPSIESRQAISNLSDFVEMLDPVEEEVEETEVLITSREGGRSILRLQRNLKL